MKDRLQQSFFVRDVLTVAPDLLGKRLCVKTPGEVLRTTIIEVEAYRGMEDKACHASRGKTRRTEVMFLRGGRIYMYLIYGMHWMFNIVTGMQEEPQAVLIRSLDQKAGPGRLTRFLGLEGSYNKEDLTRSERIWIENAPSVHPYNTSPRINIDYAGSEWVAKPWRFFF